MNVEFKLIKHVFSSKGIFFKKIDHFVYVLYVYSGHMFCKYMLKRRTKDVVQITYRLPLIPFVN